MDGTERGRIEAGDLSFTYLRQGEGDRLAVCLHGFPDDAGSMRPLLSRLADAGYTAVAPYMRGYGPTDRAPDGDYSVGAIGGDAVALVEALGERYDATDPLLVGHDWGAVAGYYAAAVAPDRLAGLAAMAVPPAFPWNAATHPRQWLRSWYMGLFQLPGAERLLRAREFALVEFLWSTWSPNWDYPAERVEAVKETFRTPGTPAAALAYYRQFARDLLADLGGGGAPTGIEVPGLVVAGRQDRCIGPALFEGADRAFAGDARVVAVRDAGHFMHQERPDVVAGELVSFADERTP